MPIKNAKIYIKDNSGALNQIIPNLGNSLGSHSEPVFLSGGTLTKCTNVANNTTVVHTTGNETVNGIKTFTSDIYVKESNPNIILKTESYNKGDSITTTKVDGVGWYDGNSSSSNSTRFGGLSLALNKTTTDTSGNITSQDTKVRLLAFKNIAGNSSYASLDLVYPYIGNPYAQAPSTPITGSTNDIVTRDYVDNKFIYGSGTIGSTTIPVFISNGTATQCNSTLGINISGTASYATKAIQDENGKNIASTYMWRSSYERINGTTDAHKDLNDYTTPGFYNVITTYTDNIPDDIGKNAVLLVYPWRGSTGYDSPTYVSQELTEAGASTKVRRWIRKQNNGTWSNWYQIARTDSDITGNAATATTATKLGTATIGSASSIIYLDAGVPTASSTTIGASNKPVFLSTGVITACTSPLDMNISGTASYATTATKLGTANVGTGNKPMYLASGTPTAFSTSIGGANRPIFLSGGTITPSSATIGSGTKPIFMTAGTLTQFSTTIGSNIIPIYLNSGNITASTANVGTASTPIYMTGGTLTASDTTIGSHSEPIFLNAGVITKCTNADTKVTQTLSDTSNAGYPVLLATTTSLATTETNTTRFGSGILINPKAGTFNLDGTATAINMDRNNIVKGTVYTSDTNIYLRYRDQNDTTFASLNYTGTKNSAYRQIQLNINSPLASSSKYGYLRLAYTGTYDNNSESETYMTVLTETTKSITTNVNTVTINSADGIAETQNYNTLTIGNATGAFSANNAAGRLKLYCPTSTTAASTGKYSYVVPEILTANRTHTLPNVSGYLATGSKDGVGDASTPVYMTNAGVLTACTSIGIQSVDISANTTLGSTHKMKVLNCTGTVTLTVPTCSSSQDWYWIKNYGTGVITVKPQNTSVYFDNKSANITLQQSEYLLICYQSSGKYSIILDGRWITTRVAHSA